MCVVDRYAVPHTFFFACYTLRMMTHRRSSRVLGPILALVFVLVIAGAFLLFDSDPEHRIVTSDDGRVAIEGELPMALNVAVQKDQGASEKVWTAVVGDVYIVSPDGVQLPTDVAVQFDVQDLDVDGSLSIGFFEPQRSMWVPVGTQYDAVRHVLEARTNHFSHWALLRLNDVIVSDRDRDQILDRALQSVPLGAHSYSIDLGYATVDGDVVLLDEAMKQHACEDVSTVREETVRTVTDLPVDFLVDSVSVSGNLRAVTTWGVGSGCANLLE